MPIRSSEDLLHFWEECYGNLDAKWQKVFLGQSILKEILKFQENQIMVAVRRNKKLKDVLEDLHQQEFAKDEFKRKMNPYFESYEDRGESPLPKVEGGWLRYGGRWKRQF